MILDRAEWEVIQAIAALHGVDPYFLAAIRRYEAGQPGGEWGEMGVPTAKAPDFPSQVTVAAKTVRNRLAQYPRNPLALARTRSADGRRRLCYHEGFIAWFAESWAPVGASNDPAGLNRAWPTSVAAIYGTFVATEAVRGPSTEQEP